MMQKMTPEEHDNVILEIKRIYKNNPKLLPYVNFIFDLLEKIYLGAMPTLPWDTKGQLLGLEKWCNFTEHKEEK